MNDNFQPVPSPADKGAVAATEQHRAIQEVQAALIIAKRFPRDEDLAYQKIMKTCERTTLAEEAMYGYPRGGKMVTGPSIRLAEAIAQNWQNLQFGIRELNQENGASEVEAFAWDVENNTRQIKVFKVPHKRFTKKGVKTLTDSRDIYELVANQGARRLRACILGIVPGDIVEAAVKKCEETLKKGDGKPLKERARDMLSKFDKQGVSKEMIEGRLGHKTTAIVEAQLIELGKIYVSIKDGMSKREDWFTVQTVTDSEESNSLTDKLKGKKAHTKETWYQKIITDKDFDATIFNTVMKKLGDPDTEEKAEAFHKEFNSKLDQLNQ